MLKKCISICVLWTFISATSPAFAGDFLNSNPLPRGFSPYSLSSTPLASSLPLQTGLAFAPPPAAQTQDPAQPAQNLQPQPVAGLGTWNKVISLQSGTGVRVATSQGTVLGMFTTASPDSMGISSEGAQKTIQRADVRAIYQVDRHHRRDVILSGVFAGLAGLSVGATMAAYANRPPNSTVAVNPIGVSFLAATTFLSGMFFIKSRSKKIYSAN
jgi:hypothetical protein